MGQVKVKPRSTPRISKVEDDGGKPDRATSKPAGHKPGAAVASSGVPIGANGAPMIEIISQSSETVPIAQYANVVIGPVAVRRWVEDTGDLEDLKARISENQQLVEQVISEDREIVEESIRMHNEREDGKK